MWTAKGSDGREIDGRAQLDREAAIDVLPDDVLLEIFNFYLGGDDLVLEDSWHKLVHVCRRWRQVVFASPCRLNLRLLCTNKRPVKKMLDIWPALPIVVQGYGDTGFGPMDITNFDAALEHNDRVCEIHIDPVSTPLLNSMKKPFPVLTSLKLRPYDYSDRVRVLPDSFLAGSVPHLRKLTLSGITFPGLPKLLLSAHHLVQLRLLNIPDSGFISPEAMVTCLSSLTNLKLLALGFHSPRSLPDQTNRHRPLLARTVLPSLTYLWFEGGSDYLESIMAQIDVPLINTMNITFFHQAMFDNPLLRSFISRTEAFKAFHRAEILFSFFSIEVNLLQDGGAYNGMLQLSISGNPGQQLLSMGQVLNSSLCLLPSLEHLNIRDPLGFHWQEGMMDTQWLELWHPFITVKNLYLDKRVAAHVAPVLQHLAGETVTEVLPALENLFIEGPVEQGIAQFIATRGLLGHPVAVQDWDGMRQW